MYVRYVVGWLRGCKVCVGVREKRGGEVEVEVGNSRREGIKEGGNQGEREYLGDRVMD